MEHTKRAVAIEKLKTNLKKAGSMGSSKDKLSFY